MPVREPEGQCLGLNTRRLSLTCATLTLPLNQKSTQVADTEQTLAYVQNHLNMATLQRIN